MDNGWEILSPEEEAKRQKRGQIIWNIIRSIYFPALILFLIFGLNQPCYSQEHFDSVTYTTNQTTDLMVGQQSIVRNATITEVNRQDTGLRSNPLSDLKAMLTALVITIAIVTIATFSFRRFLKQRPKAVILQQSRF